MQGQSGTSDTSGVSTIKLMAPAPCPVRLGRQHRTAPCLTSARPPRRAGLRQVAQVVHPEGPPSPRLLTCSNQVHACLRPTMSFSKLDQMMLQSFLAIISTAGASPAFKQKQECWFISSLSQLSSDLTSAPAVRRGEARSSSSSSKVKTLQQQGKPANVPPAHA